MEKLTFEPNFAKYVRDAFSPIGLMIDMWDVRFKGGETISVPVYVINDLYEDRQGDLQLRLEQNGKVVQRQVKRCQVKSLGREIITFKQSIPRGKGKYTLVAEVQGVGKKAVQCLRDITVK